jgi:hypothetical protein
MPLPCCLCPRVGMVFWYSQRHIVTAKVAKYFGTRLYHYKNKGVLRNTYLATLVATIYMTNMTLTVLRYFGSTQ